MIDLLLVVLVTVFYTLFAGIRGGVPPRPVPCSYPIFQSFAFLARSARIQYPLRAQVNITFDDRKSGCEYGLNG
jgi:hypothetical protein